MLKKCLFLNFQCHTSLFSLVKMKWLNRLRNCFCLTKLNTEGKGRKLSDNSRTVQPTVGSYKVRCCLNKDLLKKTHYLSIRNISRYPPQNFFKVLRTNMYILPHLKRSTMFGFESNQLTTQEQLRGIYT